MSFGPIDGPSAASGAASAPAASTVPATSTLPAPADSTPAVPSVAPVDSTPAVPSVAPALDREVLAAAELLRRSLVRFHPSFRFEEELAGRLRRAAAGKGDAHGELVPFAPTPAEPRQPSGSAAVAAGFLSGRLSFLSIWPSERLDLGRALERADLPGAIDRLDAGLRPDIGHYLDVGRGPEIGRAIGRVDPTHVPDRLQRRVVVGGAIASGVSLAGVALVAWRRGHRDAPDAGCAQSGER